MFCRPRGIVVDAWGDIFVADVGNSRIRKVARIYAQGVREPEGLI